ncbi:DUF1289 domain-containing protein [Rubripirellula sp.]|nr:DUF1289 domain-containing protein [Rubripirellula sp.]
MNDSSKRAVRSRCIGVCTLNASEICTGCHRELSEISAWANASSDDREEINRVAASREHQMNQGPA